MLVRRRAGGGRAAQRVLRHSGDQPSRHRADRSRDLPDKGGDKKAGREDSWQRGPGVPAGAFDMQPKPPPEVMAPTPEWVCCQGCAEVEAHQVSCRTDGHQSGAARGHELEHRHCSTSEEHHAAPPAGIKDHARWNGGIRCPVAGGGHAAPDIPQAVGVPPPPRM